MAHTYYSNTEMAKAGRSLGLESQPLFEYMGYGGKYPVLTSALYSLKHLHRHVREHTHKQHTLTKEGGMVWF